MACRCGNAKWWRENFGEESPVQCPCQELPPDFHSHRTLRQRHGLWEHLIYKRNPNIGDFERKSFTDPWPDELIPRLSVEGVLLLLMAMTFGIVAIW